MLKKTAVFVITLAIALIPSLSLSQVAMSRNSGGSGGGTIGPGSATTCSVAGAIWRTSSPAATLDCSAGATFIGGSAVFNNGANAVSPLVVQDNGTPVLTVADGGAATFAAQILAKTVSNSCASPSIAFTGATTTGMSYDTTNAAITFGKGGTCLGGFEASNRLVNYAGLGWGTSQASTSDAMILREAAATLQMGEDANGAAVNQTFKAHDGITGTDISGANLTIAAGRGTGAGTGGTLIFQTAPVGSAGTTAQTLATRMTIQKDGGVTLAPILFTNLPASADGTQFYCSDCAQTTPYVDTTCTGSGTGAMAYRLNGAWKCFN